MQSGLFHAKNKESINRQKPNYISNSIIYSIPNLLHMLILNKNGDDFFFLCP